MRRLRQIATIILGIAVAGCTDPGAVHSISDDMVRAAVSWNGVGGEMARSCARRAQFDASLGADGCLASAAAAERLLAAQALLTRYFGALRDAADGSAFTLQTGVDEVAVSAEHIPGADATEIDGIAAIARILTGLATMHTREAVLRDLIDRGALPAQAMLRLLRRTVPRELGRVLDDEETAMRFQFARYAAQAGGGLLRGGPQLCAGGPRAADFPGGGTFLLALEYCRRAASIADKRRGIDDYVASLDATSAALATLASSRARLRGKALARQLQASGAALKDDADAIGDAFGRERMR